jgi:hypothetical protein
VQFGNSLLYNVSAVGLQEDVRINKTGFHVSVLYRGGSGLIFSGSSRARVEAFGLGLFKFEIGLEAFKSWALITGLKIKKKIIKFY